MIQIDIPMPKNCADCCFATADLINGIITLFCMTPTGRNMYAPDLISRKDRPEWCPIKEPQICNYNGQRTWRDECGEAWKPKEKEKNMVEVVRCRACRWWHESEILKGLGRCGQANGIAFKPFDWFCADGERRADDD